MAKGARHSIYIMRVLLKNFTDIKIFPREWASVKIQKLTKNWPLRLECYL